MKIIRLKELKIILPEAPSPVGAYVAFKKVNNLLFISGQLPISSDGKIIKGKIGKEFKQNSSKIYSYLNNLKNSYIIKNLNS